MSGAGAWSDRRSSDGGSGRQQASRGRARSTPLPQALGEGLSQSYPRQDEAGLLRKLLNRRKSGVIPSSWSTQVRRPARAESRAGTLLCGIGTLLVCMPGVYPREKLCRGIGVHGDSALFPFGTAWPHPRRFPPRPVPLRSNP